MPAGIATSTVTSVPPAPSGAVVAVTTTRFARADSFLGAMIVVFTVRLAPLGLSTCTGGSSMHHAMFAAADAAPPTTIAPAATTPTTTLLAFMFREAPFLFRTESVPQAADGVNQPRTPFLLQLLPDARHMNL